VSGGLKLKYACTLLMGRHGPTWLRMPSQLRLGSTSTPAANLGTNSSRTGPTIGCKWSPNRELFERKGIAYCWGSTLWEKQSPI